jgi:hypothetical protein
MLEHDPKGFAFGTAEVAAPAGGSVAFVVPCPFDGHRMLIEKVGGSDDGGIGVGAHDAGSFRIDPKIVPRAMHPIEGCESRYWSRSQTDHKLWISGGNRLLGHNGVPSGRRA